tara:strand:+ start:621 stop:1157 length:537 start_codon:yes stop_codon:yes gene_type:complete
MSAKPSQSSLFQSFKNSRFAKKIKKKLTRSRKKKSKQEEIRNDPEIKWVNNPDPRNDGENTLRTIAYHTAATGNKDLAKYKAYKERGHMKKLSAKEIEAHNEEMRKIAKEKAKQEAQRKHQSLQDRDAPPLPPMLSFPPFDGGTRRRKRKRRRKTKKKRRRRTKKKKRRRKKKTRRRR